MSENYISNLIYFYRGIKHGFSCINGCQVPREMLKTEAEGRGFQHLPRDLANVNALENNVCINSTTMLKKKWPGTIFDIANR